MIRKTVSQFPRRWLFTCAVALWGLGLAAGSQANLLYDESVSGDLSGVFTAPDLLAPGPGDNTLIGQVGANGETGATNGNDADYFHFNLGADISLAAITVDAYTTSTADDSNVSFFGYVMDTAFTGQGFGDIDGFTLFNAASGDILGDVAGGPLGPGDYAFWIQETSAIVVDYQVTFTTRDTSQVPAPGGLALLGLGLAALFAARLQQGGRRG